MSELRQSEENTAFLLKKIKDHVDFMCKLFSVLLKNK